MSAIGMGISMGLGVGGGGVPIGLLATRKIFFEGNSFFSGVGATAGQELPTITAAALGANWTAVNNGVSGQKTPEITAGLPAGSMSQFDIAKRENWYWICEITNDIALNGATGAQAYANIKAAAQLIKTADPYARIMINTCIHRGGTADDAAFLTAANFVNPSLRTNAVAEGWCDILMDIAAVAGFVPGSPNLSLYFDSVIHPNDTGYQIWKNLAVSLLVNASIKTPIAAPSSGSIWTAMAANGAGYLGNYTVGFAFTLTAPRTVTRIGRRFNLGDSANQVMEIWDTTPTKLRSATVLATSPRSLYGFRYVDITPIVLAAGTQYKIAEQSNGANHYLLPWDHRTFIDPNINVVSECYDTVGNYPVNDGFVGTLSVLDMIMA